MTAKRASIAQVMMVVALAAANLAVLRAVPSGIIEFPSVWVIAGLIDFLIFWKLILRRSLRAFHYTSLIVFVISYFVMANFVATGRFRPLGFVVRFYQHLQGENAFVVTLGFLSLAEFWMVSFFGLFLACATGLGAAWLERRRGWDIAAFFRGAFVGLGLFTLLAIVVDANSGWAQPSRAAVIVRLAVMGFCLVLGGLMGISRLKSAT
jgi:hypothetical protein